MKMCYCAGLLKIGDRVVKFRSSLPAETFSRIKHASYEMHDIQSGENAYLTHIVFARTQEDAVDKLEKLGWRDYADDVAKSAADMRQNPYHYRSTPNGRIKR